MKEFIKTVLREETNLQNSLLQMVNKFGLFNAAKSVGGMDKLEKILGGFNFMTTQMKIESIEEMVGTTQTEELDLVTTYGAVAMYYNSYDGNEQLGDTTIQYDALDPEVIDTIFDSVLWWYLEG